MAPDLFLLSSTSVHGCAPFEHALTALADFVRDARRIHFAPYAIVDHDHYTRRVRELLGLVKKLPSQRDLSADGCGRSTRRGMRLGRG